MDQGPKKIRRNVYSTLERGVGAGQSIDGQFWVWERVVEEPGVVELGPNLGGPTGTAMYGIAAVVLEPAGTVRKPVEQAAEKVAASAAAE
jgi:hypothetical protein